MFDVGRAVEDVFSDIDSNPLGYALFLDIDGTLIDLAATPDAIQIPPDLPGILDRLSQRLGGAMALVTGRALPYADRLFDPRRFPIAGLHGVERRCADGRITRSAPTPAFDDAKRELARAAKAWPGVLFEDKSAAVAIHYRQAPCYAMEVDVTMQAALAAIGPGYELQRGKMVVEIRPDSADKGRAVQAFLHEPPFTGRIPVAIGDDVTDEAMFKAVNAHGGASIRIVETPAETTAQWRLPSPRSLRAALSALAARS
ncbi:trehalose-phosphatase [Rhizobium sp. G21]|uniref:trehalose-phosphatase n=1 Tax=Rhizobium sp. G21 TaxID=2758439 RepID=UPI001601DC1D|nr:trehalose-phosphatase [Rhizobium sp. G21]MBB1249376.1 trehalose-phosphatase [Rhizobium sp. G21]